MMAQAYTLARYYAQRDLKAHIRKHQGYTAAQRVELGTLAREWFDDHPELISQAQEAIQKWCLQQAAKRSAASKARLRQQVHTAIDRYPYVWNTPGNRTTTTH
jgi:hypothetical protein